ncbi:low temperature requirement protein A [Streptomyces rugosispiralis]|uniref:Low temperature requirement protein A n=1 Tax=Streptomyces rugosispiralis TaxID=2967341 RepID=A0ABT1V764_9ACTN|nr:low temperature requirement protein A [Streptomyces rugosispiralis]MCQ8193224.1 low temperature requirement protein A [Streptomyces rugosispiralis]
MKVSEQADVVVPDRGSRSGGAPPSRFSPVRTRRAGRWPGGRRGDSHGTMPGRDPGEPHRTATSLELLFDLCFVIAVAQASASLSTAVTGGHYITGSLRFALVFFTIWWAWMNFTWFASAYDPDDVPYRLAVLVQITGSLVLAAGVPRAFEEGDLRVITLGYAVLRTALAVLWLRAARSDPGRRRTALRFATGVTACQVGWVAMPFLPARVQPPVIIVLIIAEVSVPVWAQVAGMTPWHPHHIAERYELFTLIVLGESIAAAAAAVRSAFDRSHEVGALYTLATGGLLMVFAMWWLYFARPAHTLLATTHQAPLKRFTWAYGHYLIFASAAAAGAGLAAYAELLTRGPDVPSAAAGAAVTLPVAVFLITVWAVHIRPHQRSVVERFAYPGAAIAVLAAAQFPAPALIAGLLAAALVVVVTVADRTGRERH